MVTKELMEYIKSERSRGIDDDVIKSDLIENNWYINDIEEAFIKVKSIDPDTPFDIEIKGREKIFVIDDSRHHPATVAKEDISTPIGDKPKVIAGAISILLFVLSFLFIYKAGVMIAIMRIVDTTSLTTGSIYYFLREFPLYGLVIMGLSFSATIFLYSAFKITSGSRISYWLAVISLLILPASLLIVNYKLMVSVANYFTSEAILLSQGLPKIPRVTSTILVGLFGEPAFFISFVILLILLISYKKFNFPSQSIPKRNRITLLLLVLLFIVPSGYIVYSSYNRVRNDDFGYRYAKNRVGFNVYRPDPIPLGLIYSTNFMINRDFAGRNDAVQVTFDYTLGESLDISKSRPIVMKQIYVMKDFSIDNFIFTEGLGIVKSTIEIPISKNREGYLIEKKIKVNESSKNLVFITVDNVLVSISTIDSSEHDLINIANSLK